MSAPTTELQWPSTKVRQTFLDYFAAKQQTAWPASPVVPHEDGDVMFVIAGMLQFKDIFLNTIDKETAMGKLKAAYNSQWCLRAGGKHNDIEEVGVDSYHHSLFEMLGNWIFNDAVGNSKRNALEWSWELLTKVYGIPANQLYVTYFGGDEATKLPADLEAKGILEEILGKEELITDLDAHILPGNKADNFWSMGSAGPCGPCSEFHYDRIGGRNAASLVNEDDAMVVEIWNNVFMQYNQKADGTRTELPTKHVDTGMGFERLVSILQNVYSNYDSDIFTPIFAEISKVTGCRPYSGKEGDEDVGLVDTAYRVVADHIRCLVVAIGAGGVPDAVGRGYVLRRILRRAVRYGREKLGATKDFFYLLVDAVVEKVGPYTPGLEKAKENIKAIIKDEEQSFAKTLNNGIKEFKARTKDHKKGGVVAGDVAFLLYDTFGFPVDLTALMAAEIGLTVDEAGYKVAMEKAREASKGNGSSGVAKAKFGISETAYLADKEIAGTNDDSKYTFLAEEHVAVSPKVLAIFDGSKFVETISETTSEVGVVVDATSFYAESGGQIYDLGSLSGAESTFEVNRVTKYSKWVMHAGFVTKGTLAVGDELTQTIDTERRLNNMANHTATHVLNQALRKVLGDDTNQKGSLVAPDRFRFDFNHKSATKSSVLAQLDTFLTELIEAKEPVFVKEVPLDAAQAIPGLRTLAGEKYQANVRVVSVGAGVESLVSGEATGPRSIELCGGTHVTNTEQIGAFCVLSEEAVAKGIRRITGITRGAAKAAIAAGVELTEEVNALVAGPLDALVSALNDTKAKVDSLVLPAVVRDDLRKKCAAAAKKVNKHMKSIRAAAAKEAKAAIQEAEKKAEEEDSKVVCVVLPSSVDDKCLGGVFAPLRKKKDAPRPYLLVGTGGTHTVFGCMVPKAFGFSAKDWLAAVTEGLEGARIGGTDDAASGSTTTPAEADTLIKGGLEFALAKLTV